MPKPYARRICYCAVLTVIAVLFQSAPALFPLVGMFFSPLATFPVAIAVFASKSMGAASYFAAGIILLFIYPEEALIFFLATGIIGIPLGIHTGSPVKSIAATSGALFAGMNLLTYLAGIPLFGNLTPDASFLDSLMPYLLFSFVYAAAWTLLLKYFMKMLLRRGVFKKGIEIPPTAETAGNMRRLHRQKKRPAGRTCKGAGRL